MHSRHEVNYQESGFLLGALIMRPYFVHFQMESKT